MNATAIPVRGAEGRKTMIDAIPRPVGWLLTLGAPLFAATQNVDVAAIATAIVTTAGILLGGYLIGRDRFTESRLKRQRREVEAQIEERRLLDEAYKVSLSGQLEDLNGQVEKLRTSLHAQRNEFALRETDLREEITTLKDELKAARQELRDTHEELALYRQENARLIALTRRETAKTEARVDSSIERIANLERQASSPEMPAYKPPEGPVA